MTFISGYMFVRESSAQLNGSSLKIAHGDHPNQSKNNHWSANMIMWKHCPNNVRIFTSTACIRDLRAFKGKPNNSKCQQDNLSMPEGKVTRFIKS